MIRAWLFLIPRVIVRTITGSALRPFTWELRKSLRNQQHQVPALEILPSYRTHPRELWHSNPEIRRSLGFCLPVRPRHLVYWPAAFQIMIKNNAESSSFDLLRNVFSERFQSNIPCTLGFPAVVAPGPRETV
jgi:hypothetical protein